METTYKKILLNIAYYSLAVLTVAVSVWFMFIMRAMGIIEYQRVVYTIWAILIIPVVAFEIVATCRIYSLKYLVGLIVAAVTFLCLLVGIIVYAGMSIDGLVPYYALTRFYAVVGFSVGITIMLITLFCVGDNLLKLKDERC